MNFAHSLQKTHDELKRRGIEFAICWCAYGDEPRIDWSGDDEDLYDSDVFERLAEQANWMLGAMLEL